MGAAVGWHGDAHVYEDGESKGEISRCGRGLGVSLFGGDELSLLA